MKRLINLASAFALFAAPAMANLLTNGSFENTNMTFAVNAAGGAESLSVGATAISGWTVVSGETAWLPNGNGFGLASQDGTYFLDITGYHDSLPFGGISQTVNLAAGNYSLTFYLGEYQSNGAYAGPVSAKVSAGNQSNVVFTTTVPNGSTGNVWQQETLNFSVATAGATAISIVGNTTAGGQYIGLDNADLEAVSSTNAPEPAMALPVLLGLAGLAFRSRKARA